MVGYICWFWQRKVVILSRIIIVGGSIMNIDKEKHICLDCKNKFIIQQECLQKRHLRPGEPICKKCYRKISKGSRYFSDYYPPELRCILNQDVWDYETVKPFLGKLKTKKKVRFVCQECSKEDIMSINAMKHRKICGYKPICRKCSLKFATSSDECRNNNSKAQYIAQNRPEVLEKQRQSQYRLMEKDPLYAEKRCSKSFISGTISGMRFDSGWELYFIVYCWESKDILSIRRYDGNIEYIDENGKKRRYYPDFIVRYKNGKEKIIEIKGTKKYHNYHDKFNSARKKHGINYIVYEERELKEMGIYFRKEEYLKKVYTKYYNDIVFYNNEKTKALKERIKLWLK